MLLTPSEAYEVQRFISNLVASRVREGYVTPPCTMQVCASELCPTSRIDSEGEDHVDADDWLQSLPNVPDFPNLDHDVNLGASSALQCAQSMCSAPVDAKSVDPDAKSVNPDDAKSVNPEANSASSDADRGHIDIDAESVEPDVAKDVSPGAAWSASDAASLYPDDAKSVDPDAENINHDDAKSVNPDATSVSPDAKSVNPDAKNFSGECKSPLPLQLAHGFVEPCRFLRKGFCRDGALCRQSHLLRQSLSEINEEIARLGSCSAGHFQLCSVDKVGRPHLLPHSSPCRH